MSDIDKKYVIKCKPPYYGKIVEIIKPIVCKFCEKDPLDCECKTTLHEES